MCKKHLLVLALIAGLASDGRVQVLYGSIVGNVNASTEPIPGALVTIQNWDTSQSTEKLTNDAGGYSCLDIASGNEVRIAKQGFQGAFLV